MKFFLGLPLKETVFVHPKLTHLYQGDYIYDQVKCVNVTCRDCFLVVSVTFNS